MLWYLRLDFASAQPSRIGAEYVDCTSRIGAEWGAEFAELPKHYPPGPTWGIRNCSETDLQVGILCQKLHLARVTQEEITPLQKIATIPVLHCSTVS